MPWLASAPAVALDRVRWRIDSKAFKGRDGFRARYVPYLDAALVAGLMDAWVGPGNWRDLHEAGGRNVSAMPTLWGPAEGADNALDKPRAPEGVATVLVLLLKERGFDTTGVRVDDEPEEQGTGTDAGA